MTFARLLLQLTNSYYYLTIVAIIQTVLSHFKLKALFPQLEQVKSICRKGFKNLMVTTDHLRERKKLYMQILFRLRHAKIC